jgi:signal transduction histidine kinase
MAGDLTVRVPVEGRGDEFDRLGVTLNAMLDRNLELVTSVSRVSDNIAHELRTPLARLQMALDEGGESAIDPQRAQVARNEAKRLQKMFDALLRIARLDTGKHRIRREPVQVDEILADAADFYAPEAEARGQSFNISVVPCMVEGDRDLLFQAVTNLIDNAIKFAPEGGQVRVDLTTAETEATVAVVDSGPGVAEEHWPRLAERFFRAPGAEAKDGTGLGLTLAKAIVEAHGGRLRFSGRPGAFTVAMILPLQARAIS